MTHPPVTRRRHAGVPATAVLGTLAVVGLALFALPLIGLLGRAPLTRLPELLTGQAVRQAVGLSLLTATLATAVSLVLGVPVAWLLARTQVRGRRLLRALAVLPMVLPPVVGGVALLLAFGRRGLFGGLLASTTGIRLPFTTTGAVLAATFVAMPFLVVTVEAGLRQADQRLEEAAATLGASRWTVYRRVTLPQIAPALAAGTALCWARALGEFGATITFAGNLPGRTQTMPLAVYLLLESDPAAAYALSLLLLAISVGVLVGLRGRYLGGG